MSDNHEKQIKETIKKIKKAFPKTEITEIDEGFESTLKVPGVPGFVRVSPTGITMTFNNTIPSKVAVRVLKAVSEK